MCFGHRIYSDGRFQVDLFVIPKTNSGSLRTYFTPLPRPTRVLEVNLHPVMTRTANEFLFRLDVVVGSISDVA